MISLSYIGAILFSSIGMLILDHRYQLAFWNKPKLTIKIIALSLLIFLLWDIIAIRMGIFFIGSTNLLTGVELMTELPLEEVFFLGFLSYFSLIIYRIVEVRWPHI